MKEIKHEMQRRALVRLVSMITGKSHSRIISKMRDLEIVTYSDFRRRVTLIRREMETDLDKRRTLKIRPTDE